MKLTAVLLFTLFAI